MHFPQHNLGAGLEQNERRVVPFTLPDLVCLLRLDSGQYTVDGGDALSAIVDQSGHAFGASQGSAILQPLYSVEQAGRGAAYFDGTMVMEIPAGLEALTEGGDYTFATVYAPDSAGATQSIWHVGLNGVAILLFGGQRLIYLNGSDFLTDGLTSTDAKSLIAVRRAGVFELYLNGVRVALNKQAPALGGAGLSFLGAFNTALLWPLAGLMYEFDAFKRALSGVPAVGEPATGDLATLATYHMDRYAL